MKYKETDFLETAKQDTLDVIARARKLTTDGRAYDFH